MSFTQAKAAYGISRNLWLTVALLLGLFLTLAVLGVFFESDIRSLTERAASYFGVGGLAGFMMLSDFFMSPMPPEVILLVISKSSLKELAWLYVPVLGALSSLMGTITWALGRKLGRTRFPSILFGDSLERSRLFLSKYGTWAVAIGSITPVPFSLTCWSAGMLGFPWRRFFWPTLLRIPRVLISYGIIVYAEELSSWLR